MKNTSLKHPSTYTFKASAINKIIEKFRIFIEKSPENFEKAIEKDLEKGEDYRKITITPYGERYDYIKELKI